MALHVREQFFPRETGKTLDSPIDANGKFNGVTKGLETIKWCQGKK